MDCRVWQLRRHASQFCPAMTTEKFDAIENR
jgi:hypothetical protein